MSLETWKAEFYPIEADQCPIDQAVAHSLLKWQGLTAENLAKHGVERHANSSRIGSGDAFLWIGSDSCALCHHFHTDDPEEDEYGDESYCRECPLANIRGGFACDNRRFDEPGEFLEAESPWHEFAGDNKDPQPMIFWLTQAEEKTL
jgi:hypothetical protein